MKILTDPFFTLISKIAFSEYMFSCKNHHEPNHHLPVTCICNLPLWLLLVSDLGEAVAMSEV